ncbi:hypothetical protein M1Z66_000971 [Clostridium perfringens]
MKKIDALKIDEISLNNTDEKSNIFILKVAYSELNNLFKLGNIAINREVDEERAKKMTEYIKEKNSFYPTIVAATSAKNMINYDDNLKLIETKITKDDQKFIVIDGQHRFKSILELDCNMDRYQSVLLIDNINEFYQRKIFCDINDKAKKVTTGTKLRFNKTIENYITLYFLNKNDNFLKSVNMDENKAGKGNEIPYKYLYRFNENLLKDLSKEFKQNRITINDIEEKYINDVMDINNSIKVLIESEKFDGLIKYEVFYIALGEILCKLLKNKFSEKQKIDMEEIKLRLDELKSKFSEISKEFLNNVPEKQNSKKERVKEILKKYLNLGEKNEL